MAAGGPDGDGVPASLWWRLLPRSDHELPADLAATVGLVLLTDLAVVLPGVSETPLWIVFGLPFLLILSEYAFVAASFPECGSPSATWVRTSGEAR